MRTTLAAAFLLAASGGAAARRALTTEIPDFDSSEASFAGSVLDFTHASTTYLPYNRRSKAFGFDAAVGMAFDAAAGYAYVVSAEGFVYAVDAANVGETEGARLIVTWDVDGAGMDVAVCGGYLAVSTSSGVGPGRVLLYETLDVGDKKEPLFYGEIPVGVGPKALRFKPDCQVLAVACEGAGEDVDGTLVDPVGRVDLIDISKGGSEAAAEEPIILDAYSDAQLELLGVHLPLSKNAMDYWDVYATEWTVDFAAARANYTSAMALEPESLAWSSDEATLYVNLQENSALVAIDVATRLVRSITAYPMQDWSLSRVDVVDDGACDLVKYNKFHSLRQPDAISVFKVDGVEYLITADEGADVAYGNFREKHRIKDLIQSKKEFHSDFPEFVDGGAQRSLSNQFGANSRLRISLGSTAVDYTDPTRPAFKKTVAFGGRGISIYTTATPLTLVWDSGSDLESAQCAAYPWAHNGIQDRESALNRSPGGRFYAASAGLGLQDILDEKNDPADEGCADAGDGLPGNCAMADTVDAASLQFGASPEGMAVGVACGRLVAVTATEKQNTAFVYDITDPSNPTRLFVTNLSPESETKSPDVAYANRTLGDIDPETIVFVAAEDSPTGNPAVFFAGKLSGTLSFYEFTCFSTGEPTVEPSYEPTYKPSRRPTTPEPSYKPSYAPSNGPTYAPTTSPTAVPTTSPTAAPTTSPTAVPTTSPTAAPTTSPTAVPTTSPTGVPTTSPTAVPTTSPTATPTTSPTAAPTTSPTAAPTTSPTAAPTTSPTAAPTTSPTAAPTTSPTAAPTTSPTITDEELGRPPPTAGG